MQAKRQRIGGPRRQEQLRPLPGRLAGGQRPQFGRRQMVDGGAAPTGGREQFVGRAHGLQAAAKSLQEPLQRGRAARRLDRQRLDRGEHVLHPVVQLGHHRLALVLLQLALGDVLDDPGGALRPPVRIPGQHARHPHPDRAAVVGADVAELELVLAARRALDILLGAERLAVIRVDEGLQRLGALGRHGSGRKAGYRRHAPADHENAAGHVPFEFAQPRDLEGEFEPAMLLAMAKIT